MLSSSLISLAGFCFRGALFSVRVDDLFFFFIVFLIDNNFARGMQSSLSMLLLSSNSAIPKSPFISSSLSGLFFFDVFPFSWSSLSYSFSSFCYPLILLSYSSSLRNMIRTLLVFVLGLVPSSFYDSNSGTKLLMLVLYPCPFSYDSSNYSMMGLTFIAAVFRADC